MATMHWARDEKKPLNVDDVVYASWGRFSGCRLKVTAVYPDGGFTAVRWNKKREEWTTTTRRYYVNANGHGWHDSEIADPSIYSGSGRKLRWLKVNDTTVHIYRLNDVHPFRTITGDEAVTFLRRNGEK